MKFLAIPILFLAAACQAPLPKQEKHPADSAGTAASSGAAGSVDTASGAAGTATAKPAPPDTTTLAGPWFLQPMLPSDTAAGKIPTLVLDVAKSRFTGNTGCNSMRGSFWSSRTDSSLSFSDKIITTKMACPGYNEPAFMKSLRSATHYRLRNGVLTLLSEDNTELSRWMRKPAAAAGTLQA